MTEADHRRLREMLGVYALGLLTDAEALAVRSHLDGCADCREELAQIAPLKARLASVQLEHLDTVPTPPGTLGDDILARVAEERMRDLAERSPTPGFWARPATRIGLTLAAALAVVALAFGVGWVVRPVPDEPSVVASVGLQRAESTPANGTADLIALQGSTEIVLRVADLERGTRYRVEILDKDRNRIPAGSFVGDGANPITLRLTAAVPMDDTASLEVLTPEGERVLWSVWA